MAEGSVYGFIRRIANGKDVFGQPKADNVIIVLLNRDPVQTIELKLNVRPWCKKILLDVLDGQREVCVNKGMPTVSLPPLAGKVLVQKEEYAFARQGGVLLHPTSLPSPYGVGDLGSDAYQFIDFLVAAGQKLLQILPLNATGYGESPYQCLSAFAGNPLLISPGKLADDGLLTAVMCGPSRGYLQ